MVNDIDTDFVVRHLANMWAARQPHLDQYLREQFGYSLTKPHGITRLVIAQTADGDVAAANIGGVYSSKWVVAGGILEQVPLDYAHQEMYDTDVSDSVYMTPSFLFCYDRDIILLSERYGPRLKLRLQGRVLRSEPPPVVEWVALWSTAQ